MTRDEMQEIGNVYEVTFKEALRGPSLAHGHINLPLEDLFTIARAAIERGKPIDWTEHYRLLPENCVS